LLQAVLYVFEEKNKINRFLIHVDVMKESAQMGQPQFSKIGPSKIGNNFVNTHCIKMKKRYSCSKSFYLSYRLSAIEKHLFIVEIHD
jgi:hypothetical protein